MIGSPQDLLMIGLVAFVLFGTKKLPEMAKSLGEGIVEFKKAVSHATDTPGAEKPADPAEPPPAGKP